MMNLEKATFYEKYRLPYAPEMVDDLLGHIGEVESVADIGAGTGQLARLFADRCRTVYAVEPDTAMHQVAAEVLRDWPNIHIVSATAEQTSLPENSIDLIVVGNAYHRFRPAAMAELRRVLKPGGWAALMSYTFTNHAFTDMLFPRLSTLPGMAARGKQAWHHLPVEALFGEAPLHTRRYEQSFTEDWAAFWGSAQSGIEAPLPTDDDFAQFEAINREVFEMFSADGQIRIEYETRVLFGQPKP